MQSWDVKLTLFMEGYASGPLWKVEPKEEIIMMPSNDLGGYDTGKSNMAQPFNWKLEYPETILPSIPTPPRRGRPRGSGRKIPRVSGCRRRSGSNRPRAGARKDVVHDTGPGSSIETTPVEIPVRRGRGRPRKYQTPVPSEPKDIPAAIPTADLIVKPQQKKAPKKEVPDDQKTDSYYEMRQKNAKAAARCRAAIKENDMRIKLRLAFLEKEVPKLREMLERCTCMKID